MSKPLSLSLLIIGVVLVVGGLLLMLVIVPSMKVWPDDVDTTRQYNVEYLTLLNAAGLAPDAADDVPAFYRFAPGANPDLHIDRRVVVEEAEGDQMLVREEQILLDGETVLASTLKYHALNRNTLEVLDDIPDDWTARDGYWERDGLVIGWGFDVEQRDYIGWNDDTREPVTLEYVREEEHGGINTYYFTAAAPPEAIDPAHVAVLNLPTELSMDSLSKLANSMADAMAESDPDVARRVRLMPVLVRGAVAEVQGISANDVESVPLEYYYDYTGEYWVEPETGVLIDTYKVERRVVTFPPEIMEAVRERAMATAATEEDQQGVRDRLMLIEEFTAAGADADPLLPMQASAFAYRATDQSVQAAVGDAEDAQSQLSLFGTTIPIVLIVLGIIMAALGGYLYTRPRPVAG